MELLDYWRLIRRYLWLVLALTALVPALTVAVFYLLPRETRQATGTLEIDRGAMVELVPGPTGTETLTADPGAFIFGLILDIESHDVSQKAFDALKERGINLEALPTVVADKVAKANMIEVKARGQTPQQAVDIVNATMEQFISLWEDKNKAHARKTKGALQGRADQAYDRLREKDGEIEEFQSQYGIIDPTAELTAIQSTLGPLEQTQAEATAALVDAQDKARKYAEEAKRQPAYSRPGRSVPANPWRNTLETQLWDLQMTRKRLVEEYREDAPEVREVDTQIEAIKARLLAEPAAIPDPGLSLSPNAYIESLEQEAFTAKVETDSRRRHVELLRNLTEERKQRLTQLQHAQTKYERLRTERDIVSTTYQRLLAAVEEAKTAEEQAAKTDLIRIQSHATTVLRGGVGLGARLIGSVAIGLILGIVVAIGVGYLDRSIRTEEDARTLLGQRVLVGIPRLDTTVPPEGPAPGEQPGGLRGGSGNDPRSLPPDEPS